MQKARYKILKDGSYFAAISGLKGVWASARTQEACEHELQEGLEEWLLLKLRAGERISGLTSAGVPLHRPGHSSAHHYA